MARGLAKCACSTQGCGGFDGADWERLSVVTSASPWGWCDSSLLLAGGALVAAPFTSPVLPKALAAALEPTSPRPFFNRLISTRPPRVLTFLPSTSSGA